MAENTEDYTRITADEFIAILKQLYVDKQTIKGVKHIQLDVTGRIKSTIIEKVIVSGGPIMIRAHLPEKKVILDKVSFEESITFVEVKLERIIFRTCSLKSLIFINTEIITLEIMGHLGHDVDSFSFYNIQFKKNLIKDMKVQNITIDTDIPKDASLVIAECSVNRLYFNTVKNNGNIQLMDLSFHKGSELEFYYSDLAKTDFINNDFQRAKFSFTNSKIAECFLAETDFPKIVYSGEEISYSQAQLAFGQLQTAYQRQGDNVRASEYQAREIEAHYKTLPWSRKNFFTKLNLFFNWISNNFGRNWAQGAVFSIFVGLFFFYCLILSSEEFHFAFNFSHIPNLLDSFLKFMNPLRHFETETLFSDKNPQITPNPWSYIWDFAGRIFVAYGYYQTIQAFRRFGKK